MRCSNCGSYINNDLNICPVCGNIFEANEESEEIQSEIGDKIDRIMGEEEVEFRGIEEDGVGIREGHMDVEEPVPINDTQKFTIPDTVFEEKDEKTIRAQKEKASMQKKMMDDQYHWDKNEWDDVDDEAMLERLVKGEPSQSRKTVSQSRTVSSSTGKTAARTGKTTAPTRKAPAKSAKTPSQSTGTRKRGETFASQRVEDTSFRRSMADEVRETQKKPAKKRPKVRMAKKASGRSHAGVVIVIIFGVLIIAAIVWVLLSGVYKQWSLFGNSAGIYESTAADDLTCSLQDGAEYTLPLEITLESAAGNRIYYTLDGSEPGVSSLQYSEPVKVASSFISEETGTLTLRAVTYTSTSIKAKEIQVNVTVHKPDIEPPVASHAAGRYSSKQGITLTAEKGAKIYYTYGSEAAAPTTESTLYSGTIEMLSGTNTLSAIAVSGDRVSPVMTATYILEIAVNYTYEDAYNKIAKKMTDEGYTVSTTAPSVIKETTAETTSSDEDEEDDEEETAKEQETTAKETQSPAQGSKVTIAVLTNSGKADIDGDNYYVIQVQLYYENGAEASGMYYGVDSASGAINRLANNDGTFSIS